MIPVLLGLLSVAHATTTAWSVGPSTLYALPGLSARVHRTVSPRLAAHADLFGEAVSGSSRLGVGVGVDWLSRSDTLDGWYAGARLNPWWVRETHTSTFALGPSLVGGWRNVSDGGLLVQLGAGVTRPLVLAGDQSFRFPLPVVELRVGHTLPGE